MTLLLLVGGQVGCAPGTAPGAEQTAPAERGLLPVPQPNLNDSEPAVRQQILDQRAAVESRRRAAGSTRELAAAYGELGLIYVTYAFVEAAEVAFLNASKLQTEDFRWPYLQGYVLQLQGRLAEARGAFERALQLDSEEVPVLIRLGRVHLEQSDPRAARIYFERVLEQQPTSAVGHEGLGKAAVALGELSAAVKHLRQALELQPAASSLHQALGLAYRDLGQLDLARLELEQSGDALVLFDDPHLAPITLLGRSSDLLLARGAKAFGEQRYAIAEGFYRQALGTDPKNIDIRKALAYCLEKMGDIQGAIDELQDALLAGTSGDPEKDIQHRADIHRIHGGLEVMRGDDGAAIQAFESALEVRPNLLDAHLKLGDALARSGRLQAALSHYEAVLEELHDHPATLIKRGTTLINLGHGRRALGDFSRAVEKEPANPLLRLRYADALEHLGQEAAAVEQRQLAERAEDPTARARLLTTRGDRQLRAGDLKAAETSYSQALDADPKAIEARYQLATVLGHQGRFDEAQQQFAWVIGDAPLDRRAHRGLAIVYLLQGRYQRARTSLERALRSLPRDPELAHGLARLLATAPDSAARDGAKAVRLAADIHQRSERSTSAETLAMALAEAGQFDRAVQLQRQLVEAVSAGGRSAAAALPRSRLAAFERFKPWRAQSPDEIILVMRPAAGKP